jgi:cytochrome c5
MSDRNETSTAAHHADEAHEGPIKTPKQLVWTVVASFVVPILVIILLVNYVALGTKPGAGSDGLSGEALARRIQPVGTVELRAGGAQALRTGEQVYQAQCTACHAAGVAGAPKTGDAAAWAPRIKTGLEALIASAVKGKGAMGAQVGEYSEYEVARAVVYLANKGGANFTEPPPPAGAASAPAAEAAPAAAPAAPTAATPAPAAAPAAAAAPAVQTAAAGAAVPALYTQACLACHAAGVAGAPKLGDKAAWAPRLALGIDGLTASVIKGKNAMPPRGASQGTDAQIREAVAYMVEQVK